MSLLTELLQILDDTLTLQGRALHFTADTRLDGALPEFDSMAVMAVLAALESDLGVGIDMADLHAETFATVGSLLDYVERHR